MDTNKEAPGADREQIPRTITFRTANRTIYKMLGCGGSELMTFISGYDLEIKFNLWLISSLTDAEAYVDALVQVLYDTLMEQLSCNEKAGFVKPPGHKPATLPEKEGRNDARQDSEHAGQAGRETIRGAGAAIL